MNSIATSSNSDMGRLILRLVLGALILLHGVHKLIYGIGPILQMVQGAGWPAFIAYGVYVGEVVGPLLLIVGYFARLGAGLIVINMLVAVALVHLHSIGQLNGVGGWALELQGMYLFTALALVLLGPGRFSINRR